MNVSWRELRKRGNRLYHLAHYAKKARVRKKNLRRVRAFEQKYHIPAGPIPEMARGGRWWLYNPSAVSSFVITPNSYMENMAITPRVLLFVK